MRNEKILCRVPRDQETFFASKKLSVLQKSQGILLQQKRPTVIIISEKQKEEYEKAKEKRDKSVKECGEALKEVGKAMKKVIKCQGDVNKKDPRFPYKKDSRVF